MSEIILASQSPRRRDILTKMGIDFTVIPSEYDEKLDESRDVRVVAKELALGKALWVAERHPNAYVIGSDTIVGINGRQLEKPKDIDDARSMLTYLAGNKNTVTTGVAIVNLSKNIQVVDEDTASVYFKTESDEVRAAREAYLTSRDWRDKAGGYGIQSGAHTLVDYIEGDYDTVIGLPSRLLAIMLSQVGVPAQPIRLTPPKFN